MRLTEGDIVIHVDGSIWIVKGCVHPSEGFVAVPRVVDSRKIKQSTEAMELVKRYYFHYIKNVPEIGREVPVIPVKDVSEVRRWSEEGRRYDDSLIRELLQVFSTLELKCGVAGSHLGGYSSVGSDIDIHCLDDPGAYSKISSLYSLGLLGHLNLSEAIREVTEVSESLDPEKHTRLITKKILQGMYRGRRITIRVVNCSRIEKLLGPYIISRRAELIVKVIESDYRTPAVLRARVVKASVLTSQHVYLLTHRLRFTELPVGTLLCINGNITTNALGNSVVNIDESKVEWLLPTEI